MTASIAALIGGMVGGLLIGMWHGRRFDWMVESYQHSMLELIVSNDQVVRGFIERIKQLEEEHMHVVEPPGCPTPGACSCLAADDAEADAREALGRVIQWADAYPLEAFPEPDMDIARQLLEAGGLTLDAVSASNMRHCLTGVRKIAEEALQQ